MRAIRLLMGVCLCLAALLVAAPVRAASYDFPSAMPAGCSGSNGTYSCTITSLAAGDTVSISGTLPATITFTGNLTLNGARFNQAGSVSNLTLVVNGRLRPGSGGVLNATVQANQVDDSVGSVTFGGSVRAVTSSIRLGPGTTVAGNVTAPASTVTINDGAVVNGNVSASAQVTTGVASQVSGGITAGGNIIIGQQTTVGGEVAASGTATVSVGISAVIQGAIRSHGGNISLAQSAAVNGCVQSLTTTRTVTLGNLSSAAGVCCGNPGSCTSSCVTNSSGSAMPAMCTVASGSGLTGSYFSNQTLTAPATLTRVDGTVGFDWAAAAPDTGLPVNAFSVRWSGFVRVPITGDYRFQTRSDDGVRLWVNGVQLINNWTAHSTAFDNSAVVALAAGVDHTITMEHYDGTGNAVAGLHWLKPGDAVYTVIPPGTLPNGGLFTAEQPPPGPHHLELQHASGTGLTCTPSTVTVKACADAACSSTHTTGVTGTLSASGGSVVWPAGTAFSIPAGSATTTVSLQATTTTPTLLSIVSSSPAASNAASCNFGSPSCTFTAAAAGLLFDVPNHRSDSSQAFTVQAVRQSDNALACTPAFASVTRSVNFRCSYANPTTGTLPARVGGSALNASGSAAAACDASGSAVNLAFDATGTASTALQYADAGQLTLTATYTGSAGTNDTGLAMSASDSFIAAPQRLDFSGVTAGPIRAGSNFGATVTARNVNGAATPNFGRETSPETLYTGWARIQPTGTGAVDGSFTGNVGAFTSGSASTSNLAWTEVGRGDLLVRSTNAAGYLGAALPVYGSSAGDAVTCATENGTCALPGGTTATVYFGERGSWVAKTGQTGNVACSTANFGDPIPGVAKVCLYVATSATNGSVGDVIPHRFSVTASHACGSFSYAGQPITTTVRALNAAGTTTANFNGTATTTPSLAQAVTLADANNLGLGTLAGASIAASAFSAGVAGATPSYAFTSKTTAPQSLVLRATNGGSGATLISSAGGIEPTLPLRSGRLRLSNAFGSALAALQVPVVAEYWGGSAWLLNSADSCTTLAGSSVALGNPRGATGAASTAASSAGALAITSGSGSLLLAAPSPAGSTLSLDLALNLGSTGTDQSCNTSRPATTGAGLAWLRAQNGSCAATADRDPAARASFGIHAPETRKTVHVRDLY